MAWIAKTLEGHKVCLKKPQAINLDLIKALELVLIIFYDYSKAWSDLNTKIIV